MSNTEDEKTKSTSCLSVSLFHCSSIKGVQWIMCQGTSCFENLLYMWGVLRTEFKLNRKAFNIHRTNKLNRKAFNTHQ